MTSVKSTTQQIENALKKDNVAEAVKLASSLPQVIFNDDISFDDVPPANSLGNYKPKQKPTLSNL